MLWQILTTGKYRKSFPYKFGFKTPTFSNLKNKVIWIHAPSVGEARAAITFAKMLKESESDYSIVFSTTTETGLEEVNRSLPFVDGAFYMPFDFSFLIRRYLKKMQVKLLVLVESDIWPNLLLVAKKEGVKTMLINGKLSDKSFQRHKRVKKLSRILFSKFDLCCMQTKEDNTKLSHLGVLENRLSICGNLKFDTKPLHLDIAKRSAFLKKLGILEQHRVITIGSTHPEEEKMLLHVLHKLLMEDRNLKIIIAPRHPERFLEVEDYLKEHHRHYIKYSNLDEKTGLEKIILVDTMGLLNQCYEISDVAIVAGSYANIGGHNILEPLEFGIPVFFGPHMHAQKEMTKLVLDAEVGFQANLFELKDAVKKHLYQNDQRENFKNHCSEFLKSCRGGSEKCTYFAKNLLKSIN